MPLPTPAYIPEATAKLVQKPSCLMYDIPGCGVRSRKSAHSRLGSSPKTTEDLLGRLSELNWTTFAIDDAEHNGPL